MAIVVESKSTQGYTVASNISLAKPAGLVAGDWLVAVLGAESSTISNVTNWTVITSTTISADHLKIMYKVADSSDVAASNFLFPISPTDYGAGVLMRISGVGGLDTSQQLTVSGTTNPVFSPGVTPAQANSLLIMAVHGADSASGTTINNYAIATSNPTWTEQINVAKTAGVDRALAVATAIRPETTATGDYSVTRNMEVYSGHLIVLSPAVNAAATPDAIALTAAIPSPSIGYGAGVTIGTINVNVNIGAPAVGVTNNPWSNPSRSNDSGWTTTPRS